MKFSIANTDGNLIACTRMNDDNERALITQIGCYAISWNDFFYIGKHNKLQNPNLLGNLQKMIIETKVNNQTFTIYFQRMERLYQLAQIINIYWALQFRTNAMKRNINNMQQFINAIYVAQQLEKIQLELEKKFTSMFDY